MNAVTTTTSPGQPGAPGAPLVSIESGTPGRLRVRVAGLYRNHTLRLRLEQDLRGLTGLKLYQVNDRTGRVLLQLAPGAAPEALVAAVEALLRDGGIPDRRYFHPRPAPLPEAGANEPAGGDGDGPWHTLSPRQTLERLATPLRGGLSQDEAQARLGRYGPNALPQPPQRSATEIFRNQFTSLPIALLGVSAGVSLLTGGLADALVIAGVVAINGYIGFRTESQAERTISSLSRITPPRALVYRDGRRQEIRQGEVIPGDLLRLEAGSQVPADARLVHGSHLRIDESALTGESAPVRKRAIFRGRPDTPLGDRINMVHMGTTVTGGRGLGVVVATGTRTALGEIQQLVGLARPPETPMQRQLDHLGSQLALLSGAVCLGVFGVGLLRGYGMLAMLKGAISLAVAAIPEGLTAVATTNLAMGIQDLRRRQVAVRRLDAVETLGSVQVICLDKTGTLTENRMAVVTVQTNDRRLRLERGRYYQGQEPLEVAGDQALRKLWEVAVLCSDTELGVTDPDALTGSPTENALVRAALQAGVDARLLRERHPRQGARYRAEGRPYMATYHPQEDGRTLVAVKGSPAAVLDLCRWRMHEGELQELDTPTRDSLLRANEGMAGDALRVLGVAYAEQRNGNSQLRDLTWLGLVGMEDPIRPGIDQLMGRFHRAGIRTVMITGDQSATAYAIGRRLNLSEGRPMEIIDSTRLEKLDPELLAGLVKNVHVFARVTPAHKLQIVQALQKAGLVVAMTGDGINDGPALKAADIGVAMGQGGSDVARSVADIVLEDDNLHTMVTAVEQGRTIYGNIRKAIRYLVSTNVSEIVVMFGGVSLGLGQPLSSMQLLWINLVTDIFPALALSLEPASTEVLARPPRDPHEPIIRRADLGVMARESSLISAASLAAFGYGRLRYGAGPAASGLAFNTLACAQLLHAISARSEHHSIYRPGGRPPNRYLNLALGGSLALQIAAVLVPGLRGFLGQGPLRLLDLGVIAAGSVAPLLINESMKPRPPLAPNAAENPP